MPADSARRKPKPTRPTVSIRSNMMGLATVAKLDSTRALLIDKDGKWILATPKETFGDHNVDLTEKLTRHSTVAFKADRLTGKNYYAIAIFVRPIERCLNGVAAIENVIKPTFAYASSKECGRIFFPASAINETIVNVPSVRRLYDLAKYLRFDDPVSFVAIADESTKDRCAFAVQVEFSFNMIEGQPMQGIITEVNEWSCVIWAKNFPDFCLNNSAFGLDPSIDLREIFTDGGRITFKAAAIGCGVDGISDVVPVDKESLEKLERAKTMSQMAVVDSGFDGSDSSTDRADRRSTAACEPAIMHGIAGGFIAVREDERKSTCSYVQEEPFDVAELEDELRDVDARELELDDSNFSQSPNTPPSPVSGPNAAGGHHYRLAAEKPIETKETVDAEVQACCMLEIEAVKTFLRDKDIFTLICQRYPGLVHELMFLRRDI